MSVTIFIFSFRAGLSSATPSEDTGQALPYRPTPAQLQSNQPCFLLTTVTTSRPARVEATGTKRHWTYPAGMSPCPNLSRAKRFRHTNSSRFGSSDTDSDEESCCENHGTWRDLALPEEHPLQKARQPLLRCTRQKVKTFAAIKRAEETAFFRKEHGDNNEKGDANEVFLAMSPGHCSHLSCPFYKLNPTKYRLCLLRHDLRTIDDVIKHIQRHHRRPPYCPMCSKTFNTVPECDRHIIMRACELGDLVIPEGINSNGRAGLARQDRKQLGIIYRWKCIYVTIFPDAGSVPSPYLDQGCGREISVARDYWKCYGWQCLSSFLAGRGMLDGVQADNSGAHMSLFKLILEDLLSEIMEEYEHV